MVSRHLERFTIIVERRKASKSNLSDVRIGLEYLREREAREHQRRATAARGDAGSYPLPMLGPPRRLEASCRANVYEHALAIRRTASMLAKEQSERSAELAELRMHGGIHDGMWGELKAILVMTPQRLLMHGGMRALRAEQAGGTTSGSGSARFSCCGAHI